MKYEFTFNSKETYLQYRQDWKVRFFAAINDVRAAKQGIKDANRALAKDRKVIGDVWGAYIALRKAHKVVQALLVELSEARSMAFSQMETPKIFA